MTALDEARPAPGARRIEPVVLPAEGEDGLYTQTWYPICWSDSLKAGEVQSHSFLDGKIAVYRGEDGVARVMSGYCPHMGSHLGDAKVVGARLECPWHKFQFDEAGFCRQTGAGDPPPRTARLFAFPTVEKHGLIWAFNGETPLFEIPDFPAERKDLVFVNTMFSPDYGLEPWVACGMVFDLAHFGTLHNVTWVGTPPWETAHFGPFSAGYEGTMNRDGVTTSSRAALWGTNTVMVDGEFKGRWYGWLTSTTAPGSAKYEMYSVLVAERLVDDAEARAFLDEVNAFNTMIGSEDLPITKNLRFRVGTLTKADSVLFRYFDEYIRNYPRAHPAAGLLY